MNDIVFIATFSVNSWLHARFKNTYQNWEQREVKIGLVSVLDGIQAQSLDIVCRFPTSCVIQGEVESGLPGHHKCQKGRIRVSLRGYGKVEKGPEVHYKSYERFLTKAT